jgi:1-acyl-sn-glycerol-3-phosphate acyltransferase
VANVLLRILYGLSIQGEENIPQGALLACANHSSILDPIFVALAFGIGNHMHFVAKAELFKIPILSAVIQKLGSIKVDREILDMNTVKETLSYLKKGEKVTIFPEGTRKPVKNAVTAKSGVVKIAEHAKVPIIPVYIPRKKPLFHKVYLVIGKPYFIKTQTVRRTLDEYSYLVEDLMNKIETLNPVIT